MRFPDDYRDVLDLDFAVCTSLEPVKFGSTSELVAIGKEAFAHTSIQNGMVPTHVMNVADDIFSGCK